jgi:tetratricopeptide (TPR) repeat protein
MKSDITFKTFCLLICILLASTAYSQTNKEKKMKTKSLITGMYDGSESKEANTFFEEGNKYSGEEKYSKAIKSFEKAIKEDSTFVEAFDNMALCYRRLGDLENAIIWYKKSIELYPQGNMAHMNLGLVYTIQKEYDLALIEYDTLQSIAPDDPEGYYGTINIYIAKADYKSAIKNAMKALELYEAAGSDYAADAEYFLGYSYYLDNDDENAKIYLKKAKKHGIQIPENIVKDLGI